MHSQVNTGSHPDSAETTDLFDRAETTDTAAEETTDAADNADDTEAAMGAEEPCSRRVFFVGISGPSCCGKSTLAGRLAAQLNSPVNPVPLDGYFMPSRMPRHPQYGQNWESPEGLDFKSLLEDLHSIESCFSSAEVVPQSLEISADPSRGGGNIIRQGAARTSLSSSRSVVIVVEGFLLFYDTTLTSMFDAHLWLQADCETCCGRRHRRDRPDLPATRFAEFYNNFVWSHFLKYQGQQLANADGALHIDAAATPPAILEKAEAYCRARLGLAYR